MNESLDNLSEVESDDVTVHYQSVQLLEMTYQDLPEIIKLEKLCFPDDPWPVEVYFDELSNEPDSYYWVVRPKHPVQGPESLPILANGGYRLDGNATHITTLATHPDWRRRKIGEWLLLNMLKLSRKAGAKGAYLEVSVDNLPALKMYSNLGFVPIKYLENYYREGSGSAFVLELKDLETSDIWKPLNSRLNTIVIDLSKKIC